MLRRDELLSRLRTQSFDLLIIGGGIVGAGIARDAAMRGLKVALIGRPEHIFQPWMSSRIRDRLYTGWQEAVARIQTCKRI